MFKTNKYTKWYFQIIYKSAGLLRSKNSAEYFEEHHIIPDSLGGSNDKTNLVLLTAREHFIVHWILTKCLEGENKAKMICAFWMLAHTRGAQRNYSSRYYEIAKKKFVEQISVPRGSKLDEFKDEIINLYITEGLTTTKIAEKFNCNDTTIGKLLKKNNVKIKSVSKAKLGKSKLAQYENEIIDLYIRKGLTLHKIAEKFNCNDTTIGKLLKKNNVKIRTIAEANLGRSKLDQYKNKIIDLYITEGLTTAKIAEKFKCNHVSIRNLLKRNNMKLRTISEAKLGKSKLNDFKDEIMDLYNQGLTTYEIAKQYKCSNVSIGNLLKRNNVRIRSRSNIKVLKIDTYSRD